MIAGNQEWLFFRNTFIFQTKWKLSWWQELVHCTFFSTLSSRIELNKTYYKLHWTHKVIMMYQKTCCDIQRTWRKATIQHKNKKNTPNSVLAAWTEFFFILPMTNEGSWPTINQTLVVTVGPYQNSDYWAYT